MDEDYPVLGTPGLQWEDQRLGEGYPQTAPEGDVSGMGPTGKQGAKLDQGKCVPSALNAPANIQIRLMRKDVWTV